MISKETKAHWRAMFKGSDYRVSFETFGNIVVRHLPTNTISVQVTCPKQLPYWHELLVNGNRRIDLLDANSQMMLKGDAA